MVKKPPYLKIVQEQSFHAHILKDFLEALSIKTRIDIVTIYSLVFGFFFFMNECKTYPEV